MSYVEGALIFGMCMYGVCTVLQTSLQWRRWSTWRGVPPQLSADFLIWQTGRRKLLIRECGIFWFKSWKYSETIIVSFGHQIILLICTIESILLLIKWHSKICLVLPSNLLEFNSLFTIQRFHCIVDFTSRYLTLMTFEASPEYWSDLIWWSRDN